MTIFADGTDSRMARAASIPLSLGMRTSIRRTSGTNSSALPMTSVPSCASATTSMSGSASSTMIRPRRNSAWSSAMRTRIRSRPAAGMSVTTPPGV